MESDRFRWQHSSAGMPRFVFNVELGDKFPLQVEACFSMRGNLTFFHTCKTMGSDEIKWCCNHLMLNHDKQVLSQMSEWTWVLNFSIQDVVLWEYATTAHYVSFKATWTKSISNPTAMKDLPIIYQRKRRGKTTTTNESDVFYSLIHYFLTYLVSAYSVQDWEEIFHITQNKFSRSLYSMTGNENQNMAWSRTFLSVSDGFSLSPSPLSCLILLSLLWNTVFCIKFELNAAWNWNPFTLMIFNNQVIPDTWGIDSVLAISQRNMNH